MANEKDAQGRELGMAACFAVFQLAGILAEKGVIRFDEAAKAFASAADDMRSGTEDGAAAERGEQAARHLEMLAALLLRGS